MPAISIVVPVYNEEVLIEDLFTRTTAGLARISEDFEVVCVDDGSTDRTLELLRGCHERDPRFKVVALSRNFGHQAAIFAGLNFARGDCVGIMDGDLQDPPELFAEFHARLQEGCEVVYGVRRKRKETRMKRLSYWLYYRLLDLVAETTIARDSGDFSLMQRVVVDELLRMKEHGKFIRGMRSWVGYRQLAVEYERDARAKGTPKYGLKELKRLAVDGLFGYSNVPIKLMGRLGFVITVGSLLFAAYSIYERLFQGTSPPGFTALYISIAFLAGVQLVSLRVLGEYIVRIHDASKNRPPYVVRRTFLD